MLRIKQMQKKEALEVIVQRITNDSEGVFLADMLKIVECVRANEKKLQQDVFEKPECQDVVKNVTWLYGYENDVRNALENIMEQLKKKVFNKGACHVIIMSAMAGYCTLMSIFDAGFEMDKWDEIFKDCESKKVLECLEVLRRHCPEKIDVEGFCEARRYIRLWDSEFNW